MTQQAPSILLIGASGSGKTDSLLTLVEAGLELFVIATEPNGIESLLNSAERRKLPVEKLHWTTASPSKFGFDSLEDMAKKVAAMDQQQLSSVKPAMRRETPFISLLVKMRSFTDERTGKDYGPLANFGPDRAVVLDSLSGLNSMAMDNTIGDKVTANPGEWGIAMRLLDKFILECTSSLKCVFVLTAHAEPEVDPLSGATRIMASTLGKKLAPTLPRFFSEVVLSKRIIEGDKETFAWSNIEYGYELKRRSLPLGAKLDPSFRPVVESYRSRLTLVAKAS